MNNIKFKAWLKDEKEIVRVIELGFKENGEVETVSYVPKNGYADWSFIKDVELLPCTNLKDKNGKDIYLGDIVKAKYNKSLYVCKCDLCRLYLIDKHGNIIRMEQWSLNYVDAEVLGNIYENPELLETE